MSKFSVKIDGLTPSILYKGFHRGKIYDIDIYKDNLIENSITLHDNTTDNCQWGTIASFEAILSSVENKEEFKDLLTQIFNKRKIKTKLWLIDINEYNEPELNSYLPKKYILFKKRYTNTTGSEMLLVMIKCEGFLYDPNERNY